MGFRARAKKLKFVDPEYKGANPSATTKKKTNLAPSKGSDDFIPRGVREIMRFREEEKLRKQGLADQIKRSCLNLLARR
eukprot:m.19709 g.19709  ORF g.19709 m.19709 type:complete len:79 (-) comp31267_c0_seq1:18-254(-)